MLINEIKPSAFLADHVRFYRIIDFQFPRHINIPSKAYPPRPEHCLQFMAKDPEAVGLTEEFPEKRFCSAIFMGPQAYTLYRFPSHHTLALQVIFQPGTMHLLTGIDAGELNDIYLPAADLFGTGVDLANEQFCAAKDYNEMVIVVERFLVHRIRTARVSSHRLEAVMRSWLVGRDHYSVDKLAKTVCLSTRQLDRAFHQWIGHSPKFFLQMARFDKAFRMKNRYPDKDWLSIAMHLDYHDYQHLVKDYKLFTGYTPRQFFEIDNRAPERLLGDVEV